ncbi:hypothetical protein G7Y89_g14870 [Cudoniella acicularis]|uniref:Uncharacterized protein n=1 Tax=Cudoniella acicularis TaxID=354080 RepID=A0A8H4QWZ1_9HELO|nr:hypothetical protein G7Y89_g14870 [Cudoniella acicularis]
MSDMDQDSFPDTQIQEEVIKAPSPLSSEVDDQARRYTQRQSIYTPLTPSLTDREWRTPKRSLITSLHTTWAYESICLVVSLGAVGSIISILASFNSRPLPEWPYSLTLNTVIALLAALANVSLAVPVSNGISQLKWNHFKRGNARLGDLELFDEASRGPWGGWKLLFLIRNRPLASFGAIAMIAASSIGPFSQQVATYPIRTVATNQSAILPVAVNYTGFYSGPSSSGYHPLLPMKSAVYNGLFSESNPLAPLSATCETGNCTWPVINSLAVCSTCVDMTPLMVRYCQDGTTPINGDVSKCGWQIPQGARLNDSTEVFSITSTEAQNGTPGNYNPWATQCTLEYCAQTIETAVNFGNFSQNITGITTNDTIINVTKRHL